MSRGLETLLDLAAGVAIHAGAIVSRAIAAADGNPFDHPDDRRKWDAASAVNDGPCGTLFTTVVLDGPRRSHALHEGIDYTGGIDR